MCFERTLSSKTDMYVKPEETNLDSSAQLLHGWKRIEYIIMSCCKVRYITAHFITMQCFLLFCVAQ